MNIYFSILALALLLNLIGFIWLVINGFRRSVVWGLLVLLFSPLSAIIYALTNWFDARKPFLMYMVSLLLAVAIGVYMYSEVGGANMQKLTSRVQSGQLSADEAVRLIEKAVMSAGPVELFRDEVPEPAPEASGQTGEAQPGALADATGAAMAPSPQTADAASEEPVQGVEPPIPAAAGEAPAAETVEPEPEPEPETGSEAGAPPAPPAYPSGQVAPDPLAVRTQPKPDDTLSITPDQAASYVGRYLIIEMKSGAEQRGLLARADDKRLLINRKLYGGSMEYPVYTSQIKSIRVLRQGTEPKS